MTPGKLTVGPDGRLRGPAKITYNIPFPTKSGDYGSGAMMGVVMHTEVGFDHNVIDEFNNTAFRASAHFSVNDDGGIHQFGPVGKGWCAWAQADGNLAWYSIEHEDHGNPLSPLTNAQIISSAQLAECLSAFAGFPLREANSVTEKGYGVHYMGGAAWGGHSCPDTGPDHPVRSLQRKAILALAREIRGGTGPALPPLPSGLHHCDGKESLDGICARQKLSWPEIVFETFRGQDAIGPLQLAYLLVQKYDQPCPAGMRLRLP